MKNENEYKTYILYLIVFLVTMLSVTIAKLFWGHYGMVAAITIIPTTVLLSKYFEKREAMLKDKILIIGASSLTIMQVVFFILSDIFRVTLYAKSNINFGGVIVMITQVLAALFIAYIIIEITLNIRKEKIEVIDNTKKNKENIGKYDNSIDEEKANDIKNESKINKKAQLMNQTEVAIDKPYMEEEK